MSCQSNGCHLWISGVEGWWWGWWWEDSFVCFSPFNDENWLDMLLKCSTGLLGTRGDSFCLNWPNLSCLFVLIAACWCGFMWRRFVWLVVNCWFQPDENYLMTRRRAHLTAATCRGQEDDMFIRVCRRRVNSRRENMNISVSDVSSAVWHKVWKTSLKPRRLSLSWDSTNKHE